MSSLEKVESDLDPEDHLRSEVKHYNRQFRFNLTYTGEPDAEVIDAEVPWSDAHSENNPEGRQFYRAGEISFDPGLPDDSPAKQEMLRQIHASMASDDIELLEDEYGEEGEEEDT